MQARITAAAPSAVVSDATRRIQGLAPWLADIVVRCAGVPVPSQLISHDSTLLTAAAGNSITGAGRWVVSAGVHRPRGTAEGLISTTLHQGAAVRGTIGQALRAIDQTIDCPLTDRGVGWQSTPLWDLTASTAFIRRRIPGASRIIMLGRHGAPSTMLTVSRTDRGVSEDPSALVCLPGELGDGPGDGARDRLINQLTRMVVNFPVAFAVAQVRIPRPDLLTAGYLRQASGPAAVAFGPRGVLAFGRGLLHATPPLESGPSQTRQVQTGPGDARPIETRPIETPWPAGGPRAPAVVFGLDSGQRTGWTDFTDLVQQLGEERAEFRPQQVPWHA